jgi:2-dehydro-3-deoxygluconokinase
MHMTQTERLDVVTFGETMGLFMPSAGMPIETSETFRKSFGGAESNVAIGLARLGHRPGWFGFLGDDPFGIAIRNAIRGEGVDVSRVKLIKEAPTGLMFRDLQYGQLSVYYYRNTSAARLMTPQDLDEAYISRAKVLHVTGITPALSDSCRETVFAAVELARRNGVKVCLDPNLRLKLWSAAEAREVIWKLAESADYFLPGLDELKLLFPDLDEEGIYRKLETLSSVTVVKADGKAIVLETGRRQAVDWFPVRTVVDPVGAGDGFCAGFLSGLLRGFTHVEAARLGNLVGSLVVQSTGDWESLPKAPYVEAILQGQRHVER